MGGGRGACPRSLRSNLTGQRSNGGIRPLTTGQGPHGRPILGFVFLVLIFPNVSILVLFFFLTLYRGLFLHCVPHYLYFCKERRIE